MPRYVIRRARGFALAWYGGMLGLPWQWRCRDPKCPTAFLPSSIADGLRFGRTSTHQSAMDRVIAHDRRWHRF